MLRCWEWEYHHYQSKKINFTANFNSMGVVIRQSFWSTLIAYFGVALGFVNTLLILPAFLEVDEIGLIRLIQANALMIVPLALLGMNGAYLKYYPTFESDEKLKSQVISFQLFIIFCAALITTGLVYLNYDFIASIFNEKAPSYTKYIFISLIIFVSQSIFNYFMTFLWTRLNITFQNYLQEVQLRLMNLIIIILYGMGWISFKWVILLLAINYVIVLGILLVYVAVRYQVRLNLDFFKLERTWIKKLVSFSFYSLSLTIGASIVQNLSYSLTSTYLGLKENGILTIAIFISAVIELPKGIIIQIMSPIISSGFRENEMGAVRHNYQTSSINLAVMAGLLAIGIITNLNDLFLIIPKGEIFRQGIDLIILLSIAKAAGMCIGIAPEIITYSKFYIANIYIMMAGAVVMIFLSVWLIPVFGIIGVGVAFLTVSLINVLSRFILIYAKLGMSPFTYRHLKLLLAFILSFVLIRFLNFELHPIWNIVVRSLVISLTFLGLTYLLKVSDQVNAIANKIISKITSG